MCRQAITATVDLGDRESGSLARPGVELALRERAIEAEIAFERRRAVANDAEEVRHAAELLLDGLQQGLRRSRAGFDRCWGGDAGHGMSSGGYGQARSVCPGDAEIVLAALRKNGRRSQQSIPHSGIIDGSLS